MLITLSCFVSRFGVCTALSLMDSIPRRSNLSVLSLSCHHVLGSSQVLGLTIAPSVRWTYTQQIIATPTHIVPYYCKTYQVDVDDPDGQLTYKPDVVFAKLCDTVTFNFRDGGHTATQSSSDDPCTPIPDGVSSGYRLDGQFSFVVTAKPEPLFVMCNYFWRCASGTVFGVNTTVNECIGAFQNAASASNTTESWTILGTPTSPATISSFTSSPATVPTLRLSMSLRERLSRFHWQKLWQTLKSPLASYRARSAAQVGLSRYGFQRIVRDRSARGAGR